MQDPPIGAESSFQLLERARQGDATALDDLLKRYLPRLRRWARGRIPKSARGALDTEDVVQDTLIRALKQFESMENRGEGALQAYLRQAVLNRVTDLYRRSAVRPGQDALSSAIASDDASPLEHAIGAEATRRYELALQNLSEQERAIVIMRVEMACAYSEIAEAVGVSGSAHARVVFSRALTKLAKEMSVVPSA